MEPGKLYMVRVGECKRCGKCCDKSLAQPDKWALMSLTDDPDIRIASTTRGRVGAPRVCDSLCEEGCAIYATRPPLCRAWPRSPLDKRKIPECGFRFEVR